MAKDAFKFIHIWDAKDELQIDKVVQSSQVYTLDRIHISKGCSFISGPLV